MQIELRFSTNDYKDSVGVTFTLFNQSSVVKVSTNEPHTGELNCDFSYKCISGVFHFIFFLML